MFVKNLLSILCTSLLSLSLYAQDNAILLEAENADSLGTDYQVVEEQTVTYVTPSTDFLSASNPGAESKVIRFTVTFEAPGTYDVYAKLRVGSDQFNDDSFFLSTSFGERAVDSDTGWVVVNGIGNGAENPNDYVLSYEENNTGTLIFKWINVSKALGPALTFTVPVDSLTHTFMIGARENGLDVDKIAFGNTNLFYTVTNLENEEAGVSEIPEEPEALVMSVDFSDSLRPVTHAGSGALYGVTESQPGSIENQVGPLSPRMYVQPAQSGSGHQWGFAAAIPVAERLSVVEGTEVTIRLADINPNFPYNFIGWENWEAEVRKTIEEKLAAEVDNFYGYEIWNEQHGTWQEDSDFFSTLWEPTYDLIRELDPEARIIGPSDSYYNRTRIEEFLDYCIENECLPDIIAWHELGGPNNVSANILNYRNLERELRIDNLPISINEWSGINRAEDEGAPGISASFIAKFERGGVESSAISWWSPPLAGVLGSLLTNNFERGGGWYFFKWYGDMAGYMATVTPPSLNGDGLDGFANLDVNNEVASIIFGGNVTGAANIELNGIPAAFGDSVEVMYQYVEWEGPNISVPGPELVSISTYSNTEGTITIPVNLLDPMYGYRIVVTPVGKMVSNEHEESVRPEAITLNQNYPNPFNPNTVISFNLPESGEVSLKVYDLMGREVATLVDGRLNSGEHTFNFNANGLASGVYLYRITSGDFTQVKRMMLIK